MNIACIGALRSSTGKTTVAESILRGLPGFSALKVTTMREGLQPAASPGSTHVPEQGFELIDSTEILLEPGKDTARMAQAGAVQVLWLRCTPEGVRQGMARALEQIRPCKGLIVEGNSPAPFLPEAVKIFILASAEEKEKKSARLFLDQAHIVLAHPGVEKTTVHTTHALVIDFSLTER